MLKESFDVFELVHVPREQNARACKTCQFGKGGQAEDSNSGSPEDTSNNHEQNGRNPARWHFGRDKEEESSIVNTGDDENAQNKQVSGCWSDSVACLPGRIRGNLDDSLPALLGRRRTLILPATRTWRNRFVALSVPSTWLRSLQNHPQNLLLNLQTWPAKHTDDASSGRLHSDDQVRPHNYQMRKLVVCV